MTPTNAKPRVAFQGERGAFSEEAAVKLLGISVSTVEQQMWRALKALRAKLGPYLLVLTGVISLLK